MHGFNTFKNPLKNEYIPKNKHILYSMNNFSTLNRGHTSSGHTIQSQSLTTLCICNTVVRLLKKK